MARISRPVIYGGLGAILLTVWVLYGSEPSTGSGIESAKRAGGSARGASKASDQFTDEDLNTVFERLNESPKNAFNPLVARESSGGSGSLMPNELPASFADGEVGWTYTGTIESNGVPSALLENTLTGEGMFLKVGEKLKKTTITKIAPTYIEVEGYTGRTLRLDLLKDLPDPDDEFYGLEIEPVRPDVGEAFTGSIRGAGATGNRTPETSEQS